MELGVLLPQTEIGSDPLAVRDVAQAAEGLGYDHLLVFEHVLGVDPSSRPGWSGYYTHEATFLEPFVLFGHLAACTHRIGLATSVLVTPQRQTALVAKQAASVDVLCGGRLRLGIGIGWNEPEYEGLGADFRTRGRRSEEQVALLRALWTQDSVDFEGAWDTVRGMGIRPLPVQRPIPIWIGGGAPAVLDRVGRLADGWFPFQVPPDRLGRGLERVRSAAAAVGRDPTSIGVEALVWPRTSDGGAWRREMSAWGAVEGLTHLGVVTAESGHATVDDHVAAMAAAMATAAELGLVEDRPARPSTPPATG